MQLSLAQRILNSGKPFILFHTHKVTEESVNQAIRKNKSMDLDIAVDENGKPYIGHSKEFYKISGEKQPDCMPFNEATDLIVNSRIPMIVDCKQPEAWPVVEDTINKIGVHRCLVHTFASEFKFDYNLASAHDYPSEWLPIERLKSLKSKFPNVTTTASCKFLPADLLTSSQYSNVLEDIRNILVENHIDTICLNLTDETMTDDFLAFFLEKNIIPHVNVDRVDTSKLAKIYIGETYVLENASDCALLNY